MAGLYYNIAALRTSDAPVVLQFVASRPGEGTSAIARAFARFAAGEETGAVLLVDCSCHGTPARTLSAAARMPGPSLADVARAGEPLETAIEPGRMSAHLHQARLADHPNSLLHTNATAWASLLDQARQRYRFTILDCPAVSTNPDSVVLSRSCDGVVVVVEAESTRAPVIRATIEMVERFGGRVLGLAFNRRRFYIPRWIYRRL
jgi:Mrp family chromosome partitioning ATPase